MTRAAAAMRGLQARLILAFTGVVLLALLAAGSILVLLERDEAEDRELARSAISAPAVAAEVLLADLRGTSTAALEEVARDIAGRYGVRILLVGAEHEVLVDTGGGLAGERLSVPDTHHAPPGPGVLAPYHVVHPDSGTPGSHLLLVEPSLGMRGFMGRGSRGGPLTETALYIAVPRQTIGRAWINLLPGLGIAAAAALPLAVALAVVVSRHITGPLGRLTVATNRMAEGVFEVDVDTSRTDEVGQLARAFAGMAGRVGAAHAEMRALVANVSHDLKTPLTSILGFSQAIPGASPAEAARAGAVIHEEAQRMAARLDDLLLLSELDAGGAVFADEPVDISALLEAEASRFAEAFAARGLSVTRDITPGLRARGDRARIERVFENLLENARKFASEGGAVRVAARAAGATVAVEVANTNPGVTAEELPRLFERFYRRDRARGGGRGSGLGLAIARDLAVAQGGNLEATLNPHPVPHPAAAGEGGEAGLIVFTLTLRAAVGERFGVLSPTR